MKKNYVVILMLVLCIICVGCSKDKENQKPNDDLNVITNGDNVIEDAQEKDAIEIIEGTEKIIVNMYAASTTEYILSGDLVIDKIDIYHFESNDEAQSFASNLDETKNARVENNDVIIQSNENESLNLTRKDLLKTYKNLKEEYEYEL